MGFLCSLATAASLCGSLQRPLLYLRGGNKCIWRGRVKNWPPDPGPPRLNKWLSVRKSGTDSTRGNAFKRRETASGKPSSVPPGVWCKTSDDRSLSQQRRADVQMLLVGLRVFVWPRSDCSPWRIGFCPGAESEVVVFRSYQITAQWLRHAPL